MIWKAFYLLIKVLFIEILSLKKNLKAIDNSPVEILKGVEEIYNRINGSWNESESENVRQINFWKKYQKEIKNANNRQWHNIINTKVGSNFLKIIFNILEYAHNL